MGFYRVRGDLVENPISVEIWKINEKAPWGFCQNISNVELTFGMWSESFLSFECDDDANSASIGDFRTSLIFVVWYDRYCQLMIPSSYEVFSDRSKGKRVRFTAFGPGSILERVVNPLGEPSKFPEQDNLWKNKRMRSMDESRNLDLADYCDVSIKRAFSFIGLRDWLYSVNTDSIEGQVGDCSYSYDTVATDLYKTFALNLGSRDFPMFVKNTAVIPFNKGMHKENKFEYEAVRPGIEFEILYPRERDVLIDLDSDDVVGYSMKRNMFSPPTRAIGRGRYKTDDSEEVIYRTNIYNQEPHNPFFRSSSYTDEIDVSEYVSESDGLAWEIRDKANFARRDLEVDINLSELANLSLDYRRSEGGDLYYRDSVDIGDMITVTLPQGTDVKLVITSATVTMNASSLNLSFKCANNYAPESMLGAGAQLLALPR